MSNIIDRCSLQSQRTASTDVVSLRLMSAVIRNLLVLLGSRSLFVSVVVLNVVDDVFPERRNCSGEPSFAPR